MTIPIDPIVYWAILVSLSPCKLQQTNATANFLVCSDGCKLINHFIRFFETWFAQFVSLCFVNNDHITQGNFFGYQSRLFLPQHYTRDRHSVLDLESSCQNSCTSCWTDSQWEDCANTVFCFVQVYYEPQHLAHRFERVWTNFVLDRNTNLRHILSFVSVWMRSRGVVDVSMPCSFSFRIPPQNYHLCASIIGRNRRVRTHYQTVPGAILE